ncbi:MAG: malto-oligosyltrehalose synthase [Devosia sp.]|uniref:malto-oligosyltrehalose synthase n=1 Tax=Devosia sp. TaxID=1871048 RepID=UPI003397E920
MMPPRATYRLQLNKDFTLAHAKALVPYLDQLGVSHAYLSPILKAQPGSTHGYDTVDHTLINPEIGTIEGFRTLASALKARGMGIILDFVPNHMGVGGSSNWLWLDLLRHGPASRYADWFDVDWNPPHPGMAGKLLVPFLGTTYAEALANGDISLKVDDDGFAVWAYDKEKLPLRPEDNALLLKQYKTPEAAILDYALPEKLHQLIARQHWRLAHFATAQDEINYRRFFINNELAGIRIDRPAVFDHAHKLIFLLIAEGLIDGLRIDHIDGLLDPLGYLKTLQAQSPKPIYLAIEKILAPHEYLRPEWPVDGTTGYEIGAELTRLLTQKCGEAQVTAIYDAFVGPTPSPQEEAYDCKLRVMDNELAVELNNLGRRTAHLAWSVPATADLTEQALRRAWREVIAHLGVYRTYADGDGLASRDRREISLAVARARRSQPQIQPAVFAFIEGILFGTLSKDYDTDSSADIIGGFQQFTGPVMAKGLEDTALYRYNRLVSLNEVGAHPDRFSRSVASFHDSNIRRLRHHPNCLVSTSTHDTKRGEDIRLIIAAIADEPDRWGRALAEWRSALGHEADRIHPNDLYLLFQLLLGGWPIASTTDDLAARLKGAMTKSLREARQRSDWGVNNLVYEKQIGDLVDSILTNTAFLTSFNAVRKTYEEIGRRKALIQLTLKCTIPGIPDIYRGAEDWEQSFVDPDNRRALDFSFLQNRLSQPQVGRDDKLVMTQRLLALRRDHPRLFAEGSYTPLQMGSDCLAFRRQHGELALTIIADLSPGHRDQLPDHFNDGKVIIGSANGPVLVVMSGLGP